MSTEITWLTQEAYDRLEQELEERSGPRRAEITKRIEAAREEGDLKENGGYHAAKEEQGKNEARIRQLKQLLENSQVGAPDAEHDEVAVEHPFEAPADRPAAHGSHDGHATEHDVARHLLELLDVGLRGLPRAGLLGVLVQVVPRAEGTARAREHDRPHARVGLRRCECGIEVGDELLGDGIEPLRTVEREDPHGTAVLREHRRHTDSLR